MIKKLIVSLMYFEIFRINHNAVGTLNKLIGENLNILI